MRNPDLTRGARFVWVVVGVLWPERLRLLRSALTHDGLKPADDHDQEPDYRNGGGGGGGCNSQATAYRLARTTPATKPRQRSANITTLINGGLTFDATACGERPGRALCAARSKTDADAELVNLVGTSYNLPKDRKLHGALNVQSYSRRSAGLQPRLSYLDC